MLVETTIRSIQVLRITSLVVLLALLSSVASRATLGGVYTIGGVGADFETLDSAVARLNTDSLVSPVTMLVRSGTYTPGAYLMVRKRPGMSAINTITFRPDSAANVTIVGDFPGGGVVRLSGCNHVTIDGSNTRGGATADLTIINISEFTSSAVLIEADADFNVVRNCRLMCRSTSATTSAGAVINISYGGNDSNTVEHCVIGDYDGVNRSSYGMYFSGGPATPNRGNRILDNDFINWGYVGSTPYNSYGMYFGTSTTGTLVSGNAFHKTSGASGLVDFVIYVQDGAIGARNTSIEGNRFYSIKGGTGAGVPSTTIVWYVGGRSDSTHFRFVNNMVNHSEPNVSWNGLYLLTVDATENCTYDICNNTFRLAQTAAPSQPVNYIINLFAKSGPVEPLVTFNHYNNIYDCHRALITTLLLINGLSPSWHSDNNVFNLDSPGGQYAVQYLSSLFGDANLATIQEYRQITGFDADSRSTPWIYYADTTSGDLHVADRCAPFGGESRGRPLSYVINDVDGEPRDVASPDIGADEGNFTRDGIRIVSPAADTTVVTGAGMTIRFTTEAAIEARVEFSSDDGASWGTVGHVQQTDPLPASNEVSVSVPSALTRNGRLRIVNVADTCEYIVSRVVEIVDGKPASVHLLYPNGGERWTAGDTVRIKWTSTSLVHSVSLELSTNGGGTTGAWSPVAEYMPSSPGIENEYSWVVRSFPVREQTCILRVANASVVIPFDESDDFLTIVTPASNAGNVQSTPPSNQLLGAYPNPAPRTVEIRWNQTRAASVVIRLFTVGGSLVSDLDAGNREPGSQAATLDATDLVPGTYLYQLWIGDEAMPGLIEVVH